MRSSSLKGLVIHTADECFSFPGPDYRFGWGLMNTRKAADLISNDSILSLIKEDVLANQEVKEITVTAKGGQDLVATLCWTDYQGTPGPPAYNSKVKMLVNDLDLRVINQSNLEESLPWRLNVDSVQTRARRGDNSVDNVEKIEISGVTPGQTYKIRVSHKGNLFTNATVPQIQNYSLIVSGIMAGDTNRTCRPMQTFNSTFGRFDDGSGTTKNYFNNADCKWMINTADSGNIVQFIVRGMNLIAGDTLYAYDRTTNGDNLIKKFSGNVTADTIYSTSSKMMLNFRTDGTGVSTGWEASYNSLQKPRFDFTAASQNVCIGSPVALTVQAFTPTANWVYNWTVSAGGVVSNPSIANPTVVFSAVGTYTLTLSVSNKAGATVVTKTNLITVRPAVSPNSAPDFVDFENTTFPNFPGTPEKNWFITPDVNTWTRNTLAPFQGLAAIRIRNNTSLSNIRELVSPGIDLSTIPLSSRNLSYRVAFARRVSATSTDQLRVLASVDCGQNWTPLITRNNTSNPTLATVTGFVISDFIPEPTDYRKDSVSLSALTNGITNLLLKFEMRSDKGNNLFLDNVRIGNLALTSNFDIENEANKLDVNVFPNPSNGISTFSIRNPKAGKVEIELLDVLGRKISEKGLMDAQSEFSIQSNEVFGSVEKGIYFIKLRTSTEEKIARWVVK
jgi:PKD repeat protein